MPFSLFASPDEEKKLVEEVFSNAIDCLSDEDKKLPQVRRHTCAHCMTGSSDSKLTASSDLEVEIFNTMSEPIKASTAKFTAVGVQCTCFFYFFFTPAELFLVTYDLSSTVLQRKIRL